MPIGIAVIFMVALVIAIGVALAISAGNRDDSPVWEFRGEEYSCDEIPMALPGSADAWRDQCG